MTLSMVVGMVIVIEGFAFPPVCAQYPATHPIMCSTPNLLGFVIAGASVFLVSLVGLYITSIKPRIPQGGAAS